MIPYSGIHAQRPFDNWPQAAAQMPAGTWIKYLDNVQALDEAKRVNPGLKTVLRHFDGGWQQFDFPDHAARREHAKRFIASFIDGTFMNYAHNVDAIEEFNEYTASSHSDSDRRKRELWAQAVLEEWSDWRDNDQRLTHIRLVVGNVAIGNDMPLDTARQIQKYDGIAGYHPYIPFRHPSKTSALAFTANLSGMVPVYNAATASMRADDVYHLRVTYESPVHQPWSSFNAVTAPETSAVLVGEWPHLSGRWTEMDKRYRAAGITVEWLGTEAGPIGYYDWGGLDPMGGWRHEDVCAGDVQLYLQALDYWTRKAMDWNAQHDGRFLGQVLYNSGGTDEWKWFETPTSVWLPIVDMMKTFVAPDPEPEPPPPPPPPEPDPRRYVKKAHIVAPGIRRRLFDAVIDEAWQNKESVFFSIDDAALTAHTDLVEITARTLIFWNVEQILSRPEEEAKAALEDFIETYYPEPTPTMVYRRLGKLFTADSWDFPLGDEEQRGRVQIPPEPYFDANPFLNHYFLGYHTGNDYNLPGDLDRNGPVYAAASGKVVYAGQPSVGWQNVIIIRHQLPDGSYVYSRSAHLHEMFVKPEEWLKRGEMIGTTGRNWDSDNGRWGPWHLHYDLSPTSILPKQPGHWPGENRSEVVKHYVDPVNFIRNHR